MICKPKIPRLTEFLRVEDLQMEIHRQLPRRWILQWDELALPSSVFLSSAYLRALDEGSALISCYHVVFTQQKKVIGIAAFQVVMGEQNRNDVGDNGQSVMRQVARKIITHGNERMRVLVLGNSFATGEHAFVFDSRVDVIDQVKLVTDAAAALRKTLEAQDERVNGTLIKDFFAGAFSNEKTFKAARFSSVASSPNNLMPVLPEWSTFDDYLDALISKYRTKAKAALKRAEPLEIRALNAEEIKLHESSLHRLYLNVRDRATFKLGELGPESLSLFARYMPNEFALYGYFLEGKLVGFQTTFRNGKCLDAHFIGLDYTLNTELGIYPRMLYHFIQLAIAGDYDRINFGRTATEIKSTVGAFPVQMFSYLRHSSSTSNTLLRWFSAVLSPEAEPSHAAFKVAEIKKMMRMERYSFIAAPQ